MVDYERRECITSCKLMILFLTVLPSGKIKITVLFANTGKCILFDGTVIMNCNTASENGTLT
jgi:hypothetical protein